MYVTYYKECFYLTDNGSRNKFVLEYLFGNHKFSVVASLLSHDLHTQITAAHYFFNTTM